MEGLYKHKNSQYWQLSKVVAGKLIRRSTKTKDKAEAERRARKWIAEIEEQVIHGARTILTFEQAAALYVDSYGHKKSMDDDIHSLQRAMPFIGKMDIETIHERTFKPCRDELLKSGLKASTVNRTIAIISLVLKHCALTWRDDHNKPYLDTVPRIERVPERDKSPAIPLTNEQLSSLFEHMNNRYRVITTFAIHTGLREKTQCALQWDWLHQENGIYFFWLPKSSMKSGRPFYCVLNSTAAAIIMNQKGLHSEYVFPSPRGGRYWKFNSKHFRGARTKAGLNGIATWHSMRATFATRLRKLGVSEESRKDLLDHSGSITTHYSVPEINNLYELVQKLAYEYPKIEY
ncbi:MAG: hypothetical protein CR991_10330 [Proteobacteria bacterium]|nr:MAG: hypothetical protein CR991_10330 [Pseudomonadota bacterium]